MTSHNLPMYSHYNVCMRIMLPQLQLVLTMYQIHVINLEFLPHPVFAHHAATATIAPDKMDTGACAATCVVLLPPVCPHDST